MKNKGFGKIRDLKKRKLILLSIVLLLIVLLAVVGLLLYAKLFKTDKRGQFDFGGMQGNAAAFTMTDDMIAATGVTSVGVTAESFEVEELATALEIEEVYIVSESAITEGTKVLKLSEESVQEAREELEQTLKDAELAYRSGAIEYEQSLITAEYDRDSAILAGEQAEEVYEETLSGLQSSVDKAKEELTQAQEEIAEYQSYVNDSSYKSYFKVEEYQAIYDETLEVLMDKMEEWDVSWPEVTGQGNDSMGMQGGGSSSEHAKILASLYDVLEVQGKDLEQARSDYENAVANAAFELQILQLQLPELENAVAEAEKKYQNEILQAELTYQTSLVNAQSAESDYETAIEQAQTTYEALQKTWEDAEENLELFENSVGDGYFYASGNGTILRTMVRAGQNLMSESTIFMYSNTEEITVSVSVDQSDIARIALDDRVYIISNTFGSFEGTVTEINPISDSESRTNVTYTVVVQFSGSGSNIGANESVSVIFGMEMPEGGMEMPEGGMEMPEGGMQMPGKGDKSDGGRRKEHGDQ